MINKKTAVIGSRSLAQAKGHREMLNQILNWLRPTLIISGGAMGPDMWAEEWADEKGVNTTIYRPDYVRHGRNAPHIRNTAIANECEVCIVIWDGKSKGTFSTIQKIYKRKVDVIYIYEKDGKVYQRWENTKDCK